MSVWEELPRDPLVISYLRRAEKKLNAGKDQPQIHTAAQVIGEQRAFALILRSNEDAVESDRPGLRRDSDVLVRAIPYLWLNDIDRVAGALPVPKHIVGPDLLPFDAVWWTYEGAHPITRENGEAVGRADGTLVSRIGQQYHIASIGEGFPGAGRWPNTGRTWGVLHRCVVSVGTVWPDGVPEPWRPVVGRVLSLFGFLNSPFIESVVGRPPTSKKRRAGAPRPTPEGVRFVRLRASANAAAEASDERRDIHWRVRWIVRGHHRAQWYPSTRSHRLIYIAPYLKGPEEAPLKMPAYAVVR